MNENDRNKSSFVFNGPIHGQVAAGDGNTLIQSIDTAKSTQLEDLLARLKNQVEAEAPPRKKEEALHQVNHLEGAIKAAQPDLRAMQNVERWFVKHLPKLAGAVTGVIVHPIVGALVSEAGDILAEEFRRRFGAKDA
jgi:hypothetical protein